MPVELMATCGDATVCRCIASVVSRMPGLVLLISRSRVNIFGFVGVSAASTSSIPLFLLLEYVLGVV